MIGQGDLSHSSTSNIWASLWLHLTHRLVTQSVDGERTRMPGRRGIGHRVEVEADMVLPLLVARRRTVGGFCIGQIG